MIYEYAVEPALVADWAMKNQIGLAPQFGLDHRRVVSDFPIDWVGQVTGELLMLYDFNDGDPNYLVARSHLDSLMQFMKSNMVTRRLIDSGQTWIEQAIGVHIIEPFHAILAREKVIDQVDVVTEDVVNFVRDQRWYLPTINVTAKTAETLADKLEPLLRTANEIILIDPYFKADKVEYREVLAAIIDRSLAQRSKVRGLPSLTVISGVNDREKQASGLSLDDQLRNEAKSRCYAAKEYLGGCIPSEMKIKFQCVAKFADGDQVHNRYLLTDVGGVSIPYGFESHSENVFDDVTPLFEGQYRSRWRQYGRGDGLRIVENPITVQGKRV